jgi:hypothetical protein
MQLLYHEISELAKDCVAIKSSNDRNNVILFLATIVFVLLELHKGIQLEIKNKERLGI